MFWNDPFAPVVTQLTRTAAFTPQADLRVGDGHLAVSMDVPGVTAQDLSIEFEDGHLAVRGERRRPELAEGASWLHTERTFGKFERFIKLPDGVDADAIAANLENGVLSVTIPKPQRPEARTIAIGSGAERRELETATA